MRNIGVDIVAVERFRRSVERGGDGFLRRVFTPGELAACAGRIERLAGRWAAKEAVIKALDGTGLPHRRRRIEVLNAESGAPVVRLLEPEPAPESNSDSRPPIPGTGPAVRVSISHHHDYAVAIAEVESVEEVWLLPPPAAVRLPDRPPRAHKGTFGKVAVVAGSPGYTGAAYLAATAAARAGAGLVRLYVPRSLQPVLAVKCTEVMPIGVSEVPGGQLGPALLSEHEDDLGAARSVVLGPGLGQGQQIEELVWRSVRELKSPLVIDADGLNALARHPDQLVRLGDHVVLTPHPREMSRLIRAEVPPGDPERAELARQAADTFGCTVVLKGARTVIAAPGGRHSVDPHEEPLLATGGTGDVLAGLIGGLLAQGSEPFTAACTGVYVHAACARLLAPELGESGLLASDLLPQIPRAMRLIRRLANG